MRSPTLAHKSSRPPTPLRLYLSHRKLTGEAFRKALAQFLPVSPSTASVSQWTTGKSAPRVEVQLAMELATDGEVSVKAWAAWVANRDRAEHAVKRTHAEQSSRKLVEEIDQAGGASVGR